MTTENQGNVAGWWDAFLKQIQEPCQAASLKQASLAEDLKEWTRMATQSVVRACNATGWEAAARGHRLERLPEGGGEYLSLDVMAFPQRDSSEARWPLPVAVFELENSARNDRVAYSLWKVICVRAELRVVFAYRQDWLQARQLIEQLGTEVIAGFSPHQRMMLGGETAVVVGSRGEGETFPYGYFKLWLLDVNLGRFDRV